MIQEIKASSRISFKQATNSGDVFYTFEYQESRTIEENYEAEKTILWNEVKEEVYKQIREIKNLYDKKSNID